MELVVVNQRGVAYQAIPDGVSVVNLNAKHAFSSLPSFVRYLKRAKPVAVFSALDHCNLVALWAIRLARMSASIVISVHSPISIRGSAANVASAANIKDRMIPFLARMFYRWANAIVAVSSGVADDLSNTISIPRQKISVIPNPVVVPELFELAGESIDHPWLQSQEPPIILAVGRLEAVKDYPTLFNAFAKVVETHNARLIILGEGSERSVLERLVDELALKKHVDLYGFTENPFAFMSKARLLVLSSTYEGFGNVLVEALALGLPVVSTDCPSGPAEILKNGTYGRLVPVRDPKGLADAIIAELSSPATHLGLRERAYEFSYEKIGDQYLELISLHSDQ